MTAAWDEVRARIDALAGQDKKRVAEGAAGHGYQFEPPEDTEAWLEEHGVWLDCETRVFGTIEAMFDLCRTLDEFRTGFLIREPEVPFAMRLCSFWNISAPPQYRFDERDPEPATVQYRWLEEQYTRQRTRLQFRGGVGGLLKMFPRRGKRSKG
ncbi:MAG: hypothetical protein AAGH68_01860 [Pseudomonadota bacterium]